MLVTTPAWADSRGAPDELPAPKRALRIDFPPELRATTDYGYVIFDFVVDEKGKVLAQGPHTTLAALTRPIDMPLKDTSWVPAKREGKGVNSAFTLAVVFNPAAAAEKKPDATPRLLEPSLVHVPQPKGVKGNIPDEVVFADVTVDETGRVAEVKNAPPEQQRAFEIAAKNFRFAPALHGGQPVTATSRVPFIIETMHPKALGPGGTPPRVVKQGTPIYPFAMRASGMQGEVLVDFIVDIEGRVRNAYVVRTLNPTFDDPAVEAVRKWKFEPGRVDGVSITTHLQVPVIFTLDGTREGGSDGIEISKKADLSKLPEELRYDTPPKLSGMVRPVYPYAKLSERLEGKATVKFVIGPTGRVLKAEVTEASAPDFGEALLVAVEQFTYEPALKKGRPCPAVISFTQQFKLEEGYQLVSEDDLDALRREQKKPQSLALLRDLDSKPKPISLPPPKFPLSQADKTKGEAMVEFFIDEDGRVRLPRVISASNDAFGCAAVQGVVAWRFEPPQRGGKTTMVRVQQPIVFSRTPPGGEKKP